jgi:hypothetical protein
MELDGGGEGLSPFFATRVSAELRRSFRTLIALVALYLLQWLLQGEHWEVLAGTNLTLNLKLRFRNDPNKRCALRPWFNVEELYVVRLTAINEALENFEEACIGPATKMYTPLKFRLLMAELVGELRWSMADSMESEFIITSVDSTTRHPELSSMSFQSSAAAWPADRPIPRSFESQTLAY